MVMRGSFKGLQPSSVDLICSHQQFVDDTIVMGESNIFEARTLKETLCKFASASGQLINWVKSEFFLSILQREDNRESAKSWNVGL